MAKIVWRDAINRLPLTGIALKGSNDGIIPTKNKILCGLMALVIENSKQL